MIVKIKNLLLNRNLILVLAVVLGLTFGEYSEFLKNYTLLILGIVMAFSTTSIRFKSLFPVRNTIKIMGSATLLNYMFSSMVIILMAFLLTDNIMIFYGLIVIAASPPGVAVIPFTYILKGDMKFSVIGTFGAYIAAIFIAPLMISVFTDGSVSPYSIFIIMLKIVVLPLVVSRLLLLKKFDRIVETIRGRVVDWGFALIIFIAVGMNRSAFFGEFGVLLKIFLILILSIFGVGLIFEYFFKKRWGMGHPDFISRNLLLTIKSSGFTAATSMAIFGDKAAMPSAALSIVILAYLLFLNIRFGNKSR